MKFQGTKQYVATEDLKIAVNAALTLEKPLLVKGEPGTGKTMLAVEVAQHLECAWLSGMSNQQQKHRKACMSTTQFHA